jgi:hypothetical protein
MIEGGWYKVRYDYDEGYLLPDEAIFVCHQRPRERVIFKYVGQRGFGYLHQTQIEPLEFRRQVWAALRHFLKRRKWLW